MRSVIAALLTLLGVKLHGDTPSELDLVTAVILLEAGGEGVDGMRAVADVIQNRCIMSATTPWKVVTKKWQFSCMNRRTPREAVDRASGMRWPGGEDEVARMLAGLVQEFHLLGFTNGATHYHRKGHAPKWAARLTRTRVIGNHIFYR